MGHHRVKIDPSLAKALLACHGGETTVFKGLKSDDVKGLKDTALHHGYMPPKSMSKKPVEAFHQFLQRRGKVFGEAALTPGQKKKKTAQSPEAMRDCNGGMAVGAGNASGVSESWLEKTIRELLHEDPYHTWGKSNQELEDRARKSRDAHRTSRVRGDGEVAAFFRKDAERHEDELKRRRAEKPWWVKEDLDEGFFTRLIKRTLKRLKSDNVPSNAPNNQAPEAPAKKKRGRKPLDPEIKANRKASREAFKHAQSPQTEFHKKLKAAAYWKDYSDEEIEKFANSPNVKRRKNAVPADKIKKDPKKKVNNPLSDDEFGGMGLKKESWRPFLTKIKLPKFKNVPPVRSQSGPSGPGFFNGTYRAPTARPASLGDWIVGVIKKAHKDAVKAVKATKK
jgi:hypothetical protein